MVNKIQTPPRRNSINVPFKQRMASDQYTIDDMEVSSLKFGHHLLQ